MLWIEIFVKNNEEEEQMTSSKYSQFLKIDLLSFFKNKVAEEPPEGGLNLSDPEQESGNSNQAFLDNFLEPEEDEDISPNVDIDKIVVNPEENYSKFIFCRKNFVLFFLQKTQIVIIFEFIFVGENNEAKIRILSIEPLTQKLMENCHIDIDED